MNFWKKRMSCGTTHARGKSSLRLTYMKRRTCRTEKMTCRTRTTSAKVMTCRMMIRTMMTIFERAKTCRKEKICKKKTISVSLRNRTSEMGGCILKNWCMRNCS